MSEQHRKPFEGQINVRFLTEEDEEYRGVAGMLQVRLTHNYHDFATWVGEPDELEEGMQVIGKAFMAVRKHWEARRQRLLAEDRAAAAHARMDEERKAPEGVDLGVETDKHELRL